MFMENGNELENLNDEHEFDVWTLGCGQNFRTNHQTGKDLKKVDFDPHVWNDFPEVTPPDNVQMRCITQTGLGFMLHYMDGDWLDNRNDIYDEHGLEGSVVKFRPWED